MAAPHSLVGEQTRQSLATHAFSGRGLWQYPAYVQAMLDVKRAAALANAACGVIDQAILKRILEASDALVAHLADPQVFVADVYQGGGGIALNVNVNEALQAMDRKLNPSSHALDIKTTVNASQSTADACATAARIALVRAIARLNVQSLRASEAIAGKIQTDFANTGFMARTCLQDAMPARLDHFLSGWESVMARHQSHFTERETELLQVNLSGTVIGSGEGAPPSYAKAVHDFLKTETGLQTSLRSNLFDAAQFCDDFLRLGAELQNYAQTLAKVARDLRLLSSGPLCGFAEIKLPKLIQGSSFFSEKNNPTVPETIIQGACLVNGHYATIQAATMHAELNLNVFEPMVFFLLCDSLTMLTTLTQHLVVHCLDGLQLGTKGVRHGT